MTADLRLTPTGLLFLGNRIPCSIGRGGISARKREGDGATPAGLHRIIRCLYRPDRLSRRQVPVWAEPFGPRDLWSDDPADPAYNSHVRAPAAASHERLSRGDPLYDLILVTDWNMAPAVPGRGSAIFLHTWRRPGYPTAGCLAFSRPHLLWIANRIRPGASLLVPAPGRSDVA